MAWSAKEVGHLGKDQQGMPGTEQQNWEATIKELTRLAEKFPSPTVYQKLADCYRLLDEHEEAKVLLDMARSCTQEKRFSQTI